MNITLHDERMVDAMKSIADDFGLTLEQSIYQGQYLWVYPVGEGEHEDMLNQLKEETGAERIDILRAALESHYHATRTMN